MSVNTEAYKQLQKELGATTLVAVSKFKSAEDILALYDLGHRDFGENFVQELLIKYESLPKDICWHFIGHLQSNKVKYIVPFIHMIHGVDTLKLLNEIDKQAAKAGVTVKCLLQLHVATEDTKFGLNESELAEAIKQNHENIEVKGLMGMASFTSDEKMIKEEFGKLVNLYDRWKPLMKNFDTLSMGMSSDYKIAIAAGSNMVRIGSLLFGSR